MLGDTYNPIPTAESVRPDEWRGLTSCKAGVVVPIAYFPLLREDRIRGRATIQVKSEETVKVIINPVRVRVEAHLIPKTMLDRFGGSMEVLNRSYTDTPAPSGMGTTPKWFLASPALPANDTGHAIYDTMGIHWQDAAVFNSDLVESYNQLVNYQREVVSQELPKRTLNDTTLAQAMWDAWRFDWIKPSFDAAQMEGTVPVRIDGENIPLVAAYNPKTAGGVPGMATGAALTVKAEDVSGYTNKPLTVTDVDGSVSYLGLEAPGAGASISLANIALASKTQAFAAMRDRYRNVPEEHLIDLLMRGISVPDAELRKPMLLASVEAMIGQTERYATDGASLDTSVANGTATLSFTLNTPRVNSGGYVLVTATIVPEQLYERVADPALLYTDGGKGDVYTPDFMTDYLDPQKVNVVPNYYVDVRHGSPGDVFGYAPLNFMWRRWNAKVGGRFKRPVPDAFVEDRQRVWKIEKADPQLSSDWYLCPSPFPHDVFADTDADPYEIVSVISTQIIGKTVFGPRFNEDFDSYDKVMAEVDQGRLSGNPGGVALEAQVVDAVATPSATTTVPDTPVGGA